MGSRMFSVRGLGVCLGVEVQDVSAIRLQDFKRQGRVLCFGVVGFRVQHLGCVRGQGFNMLKVLDFGCLGFRVEGSGCQEIKFNMISKVYVQDVSDLVFRMFRFQCLGCIGFKVQDVRASGFWMFRVWCSFGFYEVLGFIKMFTSQNSDVQGLGFTILGVSCFGFRMFRGQGSKCLGFKV